MNQKFLSRFFNSKEILWFYAFVITVFFIARNGYAFNYGDQEEHLSQVYKLIDTSLYRFDYFMVPNEQTFSIRFFYKWLVYGFSLLFGVEGTCLLLTSISLIVSSWAISRITLFFDESKLTAFFAPFLLLLFFNHINLGNNSFQYSIFICSSISTMFCLLAFVSYFKNQLKLMAFLVGVAGLFQVLEGILLFSILFSLIIVDKKESLKQIVYVVLIFLITISPMLIPILIRQFMISGEWNQEAYYISLFQIRNPNHYLPSAFPIVEYFKFILLAIVAIATAYFYKLKQFKFIVVITSIVVLGMLCYYFLLEGTGFNAIGKSQWFKTSIWLTLFYSISIAVWTVKMIQKMINQEKLKALIFYPSLILSTVLLVVIFNSSAIPFEKINGRYKLGNYKKSDQQKMHEWIESNTSKDAVFLVSPADISFLCEAKRSLLIGYKSVIHEPYFMIPWAEKFQRIYQIEHTTNSTQSAYELAVNSYSNKIYFPLPNERVDYRIDNLNDCKFADQLGEIVHQEGKLQLTQVVKP